MKKVILFLSMIFALCLVTQVQAQRTLAVDTLKGAETVSFEVMPGAKAVTALCEQVGGTSDGTLALYGSTDNSNWVFLNFIGSVLGVSSPQASITGSDLNQITITDALVANWVVLDNAFKYFRVTGVGTAGDTTKVTINWAK